MKKYIFLDLDDTIFDFHLAERIALKRTLTEMGANPSEEMMNRYSAINRSCWEALERGEMTRAEVLVHRYELLYEEYGLTCDAQATQAKYEAYLSIGHHFIDGAELFAGECWDSCTSDGVHPNDLGFYRMAMRIEKTLKPILDAIGDNE